MTRLDPDRANIRLERLCSKRIPALLLEQLLERPRSRRRKARNRGGSGIHWIRRRLARARPRIEGCVAHRKVDGATAAAGQRAGNVRILNAEWVGVQDLIDRQM